jgi:hypothetical protein
MENVPIDLPQLFLWAKSFALMPMDCRRSYQFEWLNLLKIGSVFIRPPDDNRCRFYRGQTKIYGVRIQNSAELSAWDLRAVPTQQGRKDNYGLVDSGSPNPILWGIHCLARELRVSVDPVLTIVGGLVIESPVAQTIRDRGTFGDPWTSLQRRLTLS